MISDVSEAHAAFMFTFGIEWVGVRAYTRARSPTNPRQKGGADPQSGAVGTVNREMRRKRHIKDYQLNRSLRCMAFLNGNLSRCLYWYMYLDGTFVLRLCSSHELGNFLRHLNCFQPNVQCTTEWIGHPTILHEVYRILQTTLADI
jgi:hypothetical protein